MDRFDCIVVTKDNPSILASFLNSAKQNGWGSRIPVRFLVVNNGSPESVAWIDPTWLRVEIIQMPENVGWTRGVLAGWRQSAAEFVCVSNDDIVMLPGLFGSMDRMLRHFDDSRVGMVGIGTTDGYGPQSLTWVSEAQQPGQHVWSVAMLQGCFSFYRRAAVETVGVLDESFLMHDDTDLCIRLRRGGFRVLLDRAYTVKHYGGQTGRVLYPGTWGEPGMVGPAIGQLIRKHGRPVVEEAFQFVPMPYAVEERSPVHV